MKNKRILEFYNNNEYSFTVMKDADGRKIGRLVDLKNKKIIAEDLYQKVMPENIDNLMNVAKVVISAAWQDGKILPEEKEAFDVAFKNIDFTKKQRKEIEKEFEKPTPITKLLKNITSREQKMLIMETSLLLVIADNEFHPKEKEFINLLVKEFDLESTDFAILYRILPERVKKYIVREKLHETLAIKLDEISTLDKLTTEKKITDLDHEKV
ncbi:MAG: TerB family tellurite resistance protein, partial [Candidatus Cloacimonetes bacterium]|nr:TerB family tellurite resistance protein [Candidatus Cloacimonadota bacterium]